MHKAGDAEHVGTDVGRRERRNKHAAPKLLRLVDGSGGGGVDGYAVGSVVVLLTRLAVVR